MTVHLIILFNEYMGKSEVLCVICAWRATCLKQFSMKAGQKCPEFVKDVTIKVDSEDNLDKKKEE